MKKILCWFLALALFAAAGCAKEEKEGEAPFVPVKNEAQYQKFLAAGADSGYSTVAEAADSIAQDASSSELSLSSGETSYSGTNLQVEAVDEGDIVKTDGHYIFRAANNQIYVVKTEAGTMTQTDTVGLKDSQYVQELYLDENRLVAVCGGNAVIPYAAGVSKESEPARYGVKVYIYDRNGDGTLTLSREIDQEGNYLTSRKVGNCFYLVTSLYSYYATTAETPVYRDSVAGDAVTSLPYDRIYYPGTEESFSPEQLVVGAVDLSAETPIDVNSYLGAGDTFYMNEEMLYVIARQYNPVRILPMEDSGSTASVAGIATDSSANESTVYAFHIDGVKVAAAATAKIPGSVLNQFSLDEYQGHLRIATTVVAKEGETDNRLYVLDRKLNTVGSVTGLAPGETLYAARFIGDEGYLVTFEQTDPLFALDLADPTAPKVLGELKIPGYSGYLQPYEDDLLLGIGKEVTVDSTDWSMEPVALTQGVKIALFDVSDLSRPRELWSTEIGDRGSDSDALYSHKAVLLDRGKELLALPITVYVRNESQQGTDDFGTLKQQGSYIFHLNEAGIEMKAFITHGMGENENYDTFAQIDRNLYIGDVLYALSQGKITALDLQTMQEISTLTLK